MPTMLVLGATSGIARATARAFAGSGWTLQLAGRDIQRLQEVADDCGGASIFPFDALDPASRSALWGLLQGRRSIWQRRGAWHRNMNVLYRAELRENERRKI